MDDLFPALPSHVPLKWMGLAVPLFILLAWHHSQHLFFTAFNASPTRKTLEEMAKAMKWRSAQLTAVWCVGVILVIAGDIRYYRLAAQREEQEAQATAAPPSPATAKDNAPVAQTAAPPAAATDGKAREEKLDEIKFRYEDIFVSYLYLQRCQLAGTDDLNAINRSLAKELQSIGAEPSAAYGIYSAAQGSYEGIYADSPCEQPALQIIQTQFQKYRAALH